MNTFLNQMKKDSNIDYTENGGITRKTTESAVLDMFGIGAAFRNRSDEDMILLFKNAFKEDRNLALKCLFYIRDVRGGQGERRFFRVVFNWLAKNYPEIAKKNLDNVSEYGRWDDLIYTCLDTPCETAAFNIIKHQLALDIECKTPSLLAKWLPSINTSSPVSKMTGRRIAKFLGMNERQYRKTLSALRKKINVLERLMSANKFDEIEFDKIPSRAGIIYKNAFARRDLIAEKYKNFAKDKNTKVNADTLYPYDVVAKALKGYNRWNKSSSLTETDREMVNKYWSCLPDYLGDKECSMLCVVDTSGSMTGSYAAAPINVAISLGLYCAERMNGPFANHYISFASKPQLIETKGVDFVDKVRRIYETNLVDNTNLEAVFDLLLNTALKKGVKSKDIPHIITVISDMEIDSATYSYPWESNKIWSEDNAATMMENMGKKWAAAGYELPHLIYWNVDARNNNILDSGPNVTFVSGASPTIFKSILTGKTAWDLMIDVLCSKRYNKITV